MGAGPSQVAASLSAVILGEADGQDSGIGHQMKADAFSVGSVALV